MIVQNIETQEAPREWSAEVKRQDKNPGDWYESYAGCGQYVWKQYQRTETAELVG